VTDQLDPSSEGLHAARKAIDNELYDARGRPKQTLGREEAGTLRHFRQRIDQALSQVGPIKAVDADFAQIGKEQRAFDTGRQTLRAGDDALSPVEFSETWDSMSPGEREHVLSGINTDVWRKLGTSANDLVKLREILKGEGKWNSEKLATVIGPEKTDALWHAIERESTFRDTYQKVVQGSKTAESGGGATQRRPGLRGALTDIAIGYGVGGAGGATGAAASHIRRFLSDLASPGAGPGDAGLARLLTSEDPEAIARAIEIVKQQRSAAPQGMLSALLARKAQVDNQGQRQ
jgi:hypothetical protein